MGNLIGGKNIFAVKWPIRCVILSTIGLVKVPVLLTVSSRFFYFNVLKNPLDRLYADL